MRNPSYDIIVGSGVIGVCTAYYQSKQGFDVTILEKDEIASGSSFGNAGLLVPNQSIPLPAPGVLWQCFKWIFNKSGPFYKKSMFDLKLYSWLWRFGLAARNLRFSRSI